MREGAPAHFVIMGGGVRPPEYFKTMRGRALALTNLLTDEESAIKDLVAAKGLERPLLVPAVHGRDRRDLQRARHRHLPEPGRRPRPAGARGCDVRQAGRRVRVGDGRGRAPPRQDRPPAPGREPGAARRCAAPAHRRPRAAPRLGEAAAEHARVRFDPASNARAVERVYDELLGLEVESEPAQRSRRGMTLVSIVTPSLNQARYLREAIESVRAQTYAPDRAHRRRRRLDRRDARDPRRIRPDVRWISEPDRGQSHALNKGFALASRRRPRLAERRRRVRGRRGRGGGRRARRDGRRARLRRRHARQRRRRQPAAHPLASRVRPVDRAQPRLRHLLAGGLLHARGARCRRRTSTSRCT